MIKYFFTKTDRGWSTVITFQLTSEVQALYMGKTSRTCPEYLIWVFHLRSANTLAATLHFDILLPEMVM